MLQVLFAKYRPFYRYALVDAKRFVLDVNATISLGMIEVVLLVLGNSDIGENRKFVSKLSWYEKLTMIIF